MFILKLVEYLASIDMFKQDSYFRGVEDGVGIRVVFEGGVVFGDGDEVFYGRDWLGFVVLVLVL